ncbi:MAG: VWA domain-containing protein [Gammaproteobacteria bacterium]|nr:VWA domain-containing protein [Gammaproteobacteria bacterium]
MVSLEQFHFLRPLWLIALLPLVILIWMMIKRKIGSRSWESFCDVALLPYVLINKGTKSRRTPIILTSLIGLLAVFALAGPVWEKLPQPVFSRQSSLVIALDLSLSMDADDITPSRLARARFKIADILEKNKEAQTALLVYAGDAFTVTPLTDDSATILSQLKALSTDIMPVQGNRTDIALVKAVQLLKQAGLKSGNVLLMTDEIDFEQTRAEAISLQQQGYRLFVLGIGTDHGVPVPLADGSFLKDSKGKIVVPVLHEKPMQSIAKSGGGRYLRMTVDDRDIDSLQTIFSSAGIDGEIETTELQTDVWYEQGPWLLIFLLPLTALLFRRGYLVILIFLLPFPQKAQAFDWNNLWLTADQRAKQVLDYGDHKQAAAIFKDPHWKAAAHYQAGEFDAAVESLATVENIEGLYNKANALARSGRYQQAIDGYKKVLEKKSDHGDALY